MPSPISPSLFPIPTASLPLSRPSLPRIAPSDRVVQGSRGPAPAPSLQQVSNVLDRQRLSPSQMLWVAESLRRMDADALLADGPAALDRVMHRLAQHGAMAAGPDQVEMMAMAASAAAHVLDPLGSGEAAVGALSETTRGAIDRLVEGLDARITPGDLQNRLTQQGGLHAERALTVLQNLPGTSFDAPPSSFREIFERILSGLRPTSGGDASPRGASMTDTLVGLVEMEELLQEEVIEMLSSSDQLGQATIMTAENILKTSNNKIRALQAVAEEEHEMRKRAAESIS